MATVGVTKSKLADQRYVIFGAGSAGLGIAKQVQDAIILTDDEWTDVPTNEAGEVELLKVVKKDEDASNFKIILCSLLYIGLLNPSVMLCLFLPPPTQLPQQLPQHHT
ncbi:hypothetical protein DFH29DRAFT_1047855 [Suillus ampliporus]|nr:hypothetical protein DFH29DRAFT_1047855 [Suillus ampliporus]